MKITEITYTVKELQLDAGTVRNNPDTDFIEITWGNKTLAVPPHGLHALAKLINAAKKTFSKEPLPTWNP